MKIVMSNQKKLTSAEFELLYGTSALAELFENKLLVSEDPFSRTGSLSKQFTDLIEELESKVMINNMWYAAIAGYVCYLYFRSEDDLNRVIQYFKDINEEDTVSS